MKARALFLAVCVFASGLNAPAQAQVGGGVQQKGPVAQGSTDCAQWSGPGQIVDSGAGCGGSSAAIVIGTTTVTGGTTSDCLTVGAGPVLAQAPCSAASGANPTGTAGPVAVDGSATTFLRSDGAPAVQVGSSSQLGILEVDGTTITASAGVISAVNTGTVTSVCTGPGAVGGCITSTGTIQTRELPATTRTTGNYATTDAGTLVNYSSASDQTPTLPLSAAAGAGTLFFDTCNIGTQSQTITASGSDTIGGTSNTTLLLGTGTKPSFPCGRFINDGVSVWWFLPYSPAGAGSGNALFGTTTGNTANDIVTMANTTVGVQDSGTLLSSLAPLASPTFTGTFTLGSSTLTSSLATLAVPVVVTTTTSPTLSTNTNLWLAGLTTAPTFGASGQGAIYVTTAGGLVLQGRGTADITLLTRAGSNSCTVNSGAALTCNGGFNATNAGTGFFQSAAANSTLTSISVSNTNAGASAANQIIFSNNTDNFSFLYNGTGNSGGNGTGSFTMNNPDATNTGGIFLATGGTNALTISKAQLVALPAITTDSTHTDATICEDSTSHALYFGSGTAGICLGTSSLRFKHGLSSLDPGLEQIKKLKPVRYFLNADHGDPNKPLYGFTAEQGGQVLPELVGRDAQGQPNSFDYVGVIPVLVHAIQQQQAEIVDLKDQISKLSHR